MEKSMVTCIVIFVVLLVLTCSVVIEVILQCYFNRNKNNTKSWYTLVLEGWKIDIDIKSYWKFALAIILNSNTKDDISELY